MNENKRTTVSITEQRRLKIERAAIEISQANGKQIKWTDLINWMIDNYTDEAKQDMKARGLAKK